MAGLDTIARLLQSGTRGFTTGVLGAPVDVANMAMGGVGGQAPVMGSQWIGDKLQSLGLVAPPAQDASGAAAELAGGIASPEGVLGAAAKLGTIGKLLAGGAKGVPAAQAIFAGVRAGGAPLNNLETALKLESGGANRDQIWNATGWFRGPDSKWRYEIDDSASKALPGFGYGSTQDMKRGDTGSEAVSALFEHKPLGEAYPGTTAGYDPTGARLVASVRPSGGSSAYFDPTMNTIGVGLDESAAPAMLVNRESMLHELQHAVQGREGFSPGTNLADGDVDAYRRAAGEAEARAVQARMNMSPLARQTIPPWQSYDVPWDRLIIR